MPTPDEKLTLADPREVVTCLTLGLTRGPQRERFQAAEVMSKIVAERLVAELESSGFVVMRKPSRLVAPAIIQVGVALSVRNVSAFVLLAVRLLQP